MNDNVIPLGPRRAIAQDDCRGWTPRELLVYLLTRIDNDPTFVPTAILVCYLQKCPESTMTGLRRSQASLLETIGMIETAKHDLLEQVL